MVPALDKVVVVLVRARNPLNIGAAARAMSNFGFSDLRLVTDYDVPFETARSAVNAEHLLQSARQFRTVAEAVADCSLVYGTSALGPRKLEHPVDLLPDAGERIRLQLAADRAETSSAAILFGSEKTGLSNEELSYCHRLLTIPMHSSGISMNLGQAVAICLYELARESAAPRALPETPALATAAELGRFEAILRDALLVAEYDRRFPGNVDPETMRELVRRMQLHREDVGTWMGMLRQVLWKLRGGPERA